MLEAVLPAGPLAPVFGGVLGCNRSTTFWNNSTNCSCKLVCVDVSVAISPNSGAITAVLVGCVDARSPDTTVFMSGKASDG